MVGLSNLQFVDLNSSRNMFTLGTSLLLGMAVPYWTKSNRQHIDTGMRQKINSTAFFCLNYFTLFVAGWFFSGAEVVDEIFRVLLSTNMFIGGTVAFFLDNTIPGDYIYNCY